MTDNKTILAQGEDVSLGSITDILTTNIRDMGFEGRSAIYDIARAIVEAYTSDENEAPRFYPVIEAHLLPGYLEAGRPREEADLINRSPRFDGYNIALMNAIHGAGELAEMWGTKACTVHNTVPEMKNVIIGKTEYTLHNDVYIPIPANALGFPHREAVFYIFGGTMDEPPAFRVEMLTDESSSADMTLARRESREVFSYIQKWALSRNPYRGTVHTVDLNQMGVVPGKILDLESESREDVFLEEEVWANLDEQLRIFGKEGETLKSAGLRSSRGVLLQGWPGCGKTKTVRVLANEMQQQGITVIIATTDAARHVGDVITYAKQFERCVVVLEDVDSIVGVRGTSALSDFLNAMDGVDQQNQILTIATTNDGTALDPAAVRPGRIDAVIDVGTLNKAAITHMVGGLAAKMGFAEDVDAARVADAVLAQKSDVTGAMLEGLVISTMLKYSEMTTDALVRYIHTDWVTEDPRKNFIDNLHSSTRRNGTVAAGGRSF